MINIQPAQRTEIEISKAALLLEISMCGTAPLAYGSNAKSVLRLLYAHKGTLQSFTRAHFAYIGNRQVGLIVTIPGNEYQNRAEATRKILRKAGWKPWFRHSLTRLHRRIFGTPLGPVKTSQFHIESIAVFPENQNSGVGKALIQESIKRAYASGYSRLSADVSANNNASRNLMKATGFATITNTKNQLKLVNLH